MDVFECIRSRRSVRKFLPVPVEFEKLGKILDAGRFAPSAGNVQDWKFVVVTEDSIKRAVAVACVQQLWIESAPVIVVVCGEPVKGERLYGARGKSVYAVQNCAAAIENMLLVAHGVGLGACWVGAFELDMLRSALSVPGDVVPQAVVCLGYADEKPPVPPRYELENVVFLERYGNRIRDIAMFMEDYSIHVQKAVSKLKGFVSKIVQKAKQ